MSGIQKSCLATIIDSHTVTTRRIWEKRQADGRSTDQLRLKASLVKRWGGARARMRWKEKGQLRIIKKKIR